MAVHFPTTQDGKGVATGPTASAYGIGVLCWLLSAGVYIAAKWVAPEMPPWTLCFWRVFLACLILVPVVQHDFPAMRAALAAHWPSILFIGGLHHADAITAGIIMALMPIATMVIARFMLGEAMTALQTFGALFALAGMVVIVSRGAPASLLRIGVNPGELWVVASAISFGFYTVLLKKARFTLPRMPLLVLLLGAGALTALPFWLYEELTGARTTLTTGGVLALLYAAVPGGALMYYLFNWSVEALGASRASLMLYLQTIFVAILAYLILGERLHPFHLAGAALIVVGIVLANIKARMSDPARQ